MKKIITRKGISILVSDIDFEELSKHTWGINSYGYARTTVGGVDEVRHEVRMSRMIMAAKPWEYVDHADGNKLNNQRENLRLCTQSQNGANRQHAPHSASGF